MWWFFGRKPEHTSWRPLHQRERPEYRPEEQLVIGGLRLLAWGDRQLRSMGFDPALLRQPQQRHPGGMTPIPPTPRDTGEMPQLDFPKCDPREWADVDTVKKLPLRDLLELPLPDNALPVQRQPPANSAPAQMQGTANDGQLDAMLETLPYSNQAQEARPLTVLELPPWIGATRANSRPLPPLMGFSDLDLTPDLPTEKQTQEQADAWLNDLPGSNVAHVEFWGSPDVPMLPALKDPAPDKLSVEDKTNQFDLVEADCAPAEDNQPTLLHERTIRKRNFEQAISGLLESENEA